MVAEVLVRTRGAPDQHGEVAALVPVARRAVGGREVRASTP